MAKAQAKQTPRKVIAPVTASPSLDNADSPATTRDAAFNSTNIITEKVEDDDMVTAIVPKAFQLTLDNHERVAYEPGTMDMPRAHAEHWFAVAMGVEIYNPKG